MVHCNLDSFGLSCSRFSGDENRLIFSPKSKSLEREGGNFIDVGFYELSRISFMLFPDKLIRVVGSNLLGIDRREPLEGVDGDDNVTSSGVWMIVLVSVFKIVKNGGLLR